MDSPLCQACVDHSSEVVVFPSSTAEVRYLCSNCYSRSDDDGLKALPYSYISMEQDGNVLGIGEEFAAKAGELIEAHLYYEEHVKTNSQRERSEYERQFTDLIQRLQRLKDNVLGSIDDITAHEIEHTEGVVLDLRTAKANRTLLRHSAYLAPQFTAAEPLQWQPFVATPLDLQGIVAQLTANLGVIPNRQLMPVSIAAQPVEEDDVAIMPIDTLNILVIKLSSKRPERKIIPCTNFFYRSQARWCQVEKNQFIYTGGQYKGAPVPFTDFISTADIGAERPSITFVKGKEMGIARIRHAVVHLNRSVYAIGGEWAKTATNDRSLGIEVLRYDQSWTSSEWAGVCAFPPILDPTATVFNNSVYISGKSRGVFKFDPVALRCDCVQFSNCINLDCLVEQPAANGQKLADGRYPLPRQTSNTLILSWESKVVSLQHNHAYIFSPNPTVDAQDIGKKKLTSTRPWNCAFPAVVRGNKSYFMLEPTDPGHLQTGDVWCYDFIKKEVSRVDFQNTKANN